MRPQILLFDENLSTSPKTLSGQLYQLLTSQDWECHSVHDYSELVGHPDEEIIDFAKKQGWSLLTLDKRMAYLAVKEGVPTYLILHEKRLEDQEEIEEYTVVHLEPFANVAARKSYSAEITLEKSNKT
jgi:predicted nuclease of predicted toxin-antitoxin system